MKEQDEGFDFLGWWEVLTKGKRSYLRKLITVIAGAVLLAFSAALAYNSVYIYQEARQRTKNHLEDVSHQVNQRISNQIEASITELEIIREMASRIPIEESAAYLQGEIAVSGFDRIRWAAGTSEAEVWLKNNYGEGYGLDRQMLEADQVQLLAVPEQDTILYFVKGGKNRNTVLIGIKTNRRLQELLSDNSLSGDSVSFAITMDGKVVAKPEKERLFQELGRMWNDGAQQDDFMKTKEEILAGNKGIMEWKDSRGELILMYYERLDYADWYVLNLVQAKSLGVENEYNTWQNLYLIMGMILIAGGLFVYLNIAYERYIRNIERLAYYDPVTGGQNRNFFVPEMEKLIAGRKEEYTVVSLDLKDFKLINTMYGREEGDRTLRFLYQEIVHHLGREELAVRESGDIFYMLLKCSRPADIRARMDVICQSISEKSAQMASAHYLELRCGIYPIRQEADRVDEMLENANLARKNGIEQNSSGYFFYDQEWKLQQIREKETMRSLNDALENHEFEMYLQPKVALADNRIEGAEALVRWNHPAKGMVPPYQFIPVFEKYRVIDQVDRFMFESVCRLLARWKKEGRELCVISVNVSRQDFEMPGFPEEYEGICRRYGISPEYIELEITETVFISDMEQSRRILEKIREIGFHCSMDDFGSGYSALGTLKELTVDTLKLDRSFFVGEGDTTRGRAVIGTILELARKLGCHVVAEGIDNSEQVQYLRSQGCDAVQGFVFFRPMPVGQFEETVYDGMKLKCL